MQLTILQFSENFTGKKLIADKNMMTMLRKIVYILIISCTAISCSVYDPHLVDIPLINKKNDARFDAGFSAMFLWNCTFSYGLTKNIAIQTFGTWSDHDRYFVHQAVGYFKDIGNRKIIEIYGGVGYGYGDAYKDANPGDLLGNYQLYFTQFNFGKIDCKFAHADIGFGIRTGILHSKLTDKNYYGRYFPVTDYKQISDNCLTFEPNVFIRLGGQRFKFSLKLGGCLIYKFTNRDKMLPYNMLNLGIGFNYNFRHKPPLNPEIK
jgi:hypothetical protein